MKKPLVFLALSLSYNMFTNTAQAEEIFVPKISLVAGISETTTSSFVDNGRALNSASGVGSYALQYQFLPRWGVSLQSGGNIEDCLLQCFDQNMSINKEGGLVRSSYSATVINLEGMYVLPLDYNLMLTLSAGLSSVKEEIDSVACSEYYIGGGLFGGAHCAIGAERIDLSSDESKYSGIVGIHLKYLLSDSWAVGLGAKYSNYRNGLRQLTLVDLSFSF